MQAAGAALEDVVRRGLASARPGGVRRRGGRLLPQCLPVEGAEHPELALRHAAMVAGVRAAMRAAHHTDDSASAPRIPSWNDRSTKRCAVPWGP